MRKSHVLAVAFAMMLMMGLAGGGAFASSVKQAVDVYFRGISISVNGNMVATEAEPLIYQDRTYVPVRAVAEALGADVSWDAEQNRVTINGRVRLSVQQPPAKEHFNTLSGFWYAISGLVLNDTDRPIQQLALSCKVFSADGVQLDRSAWTLKSAVPPGATPFRLTMDKRDDEKELPAATKATCEIEYIKY